MADIPDYEHGQPKPIPRPGQPSMHVKAVESICERREYGREKYGTDLQIGNGRDFLTDAHEEAVDLLAYLEGCRAEREVEKEILRRLLRGAESGEDVNLDDLPMIPWIRDVILEIAEEGLIQVGPRRTTTGSDSSQA